MPDLRVVKRWQGWPAGTNGVAFDSRYQHYAQHQRDGTISFRQVDGDKEMARRAGVPASQLDRWVRMKYSPNDRYMVVAHVDRKTDRSLQIWDMATEPVISLTLPDVPALCDFDRDDKSVWVGLADKTIRRYELPSGRELDRFPPGCTPHQLALRPDGRMLAVSTGDFAGVEVRDTKSGAIVHKLSLKSGAESLAWPPHGQGLATGCEDHHIYLWRSDNWQSLGHLEGHRWYAGDLSFSRSGAFLVSLGLERTLRLWDVAAGKSILSLPNPKAIGFSRDDSVLGVQIKGTELGICEMHDSRECRSLTTRAGENVLWVGFSHDSKLMATAGQDGIVVWDAEAATPVARLPIGWCAGVLFEPNDRAFLAFAAGELMRWPIEHTGDRSSAPNRIGKGERIAKLDHPPDAPRLNWVGPSGSKMTVMNRKWTGLLDLRMPAQLTQKWDTPDAGYVASSPDGRWIATGTYSGKGIRIWDAKNNVIAQDWLIGDAEVAFSPDGRRLVIATGLMSPGGSECISWDVGAWKSGARYTIDRTSSPAPLAFSSDGKILAVAHTMTDIVLLDAETFRELATLQAREPLLLSWITFSPDGRWLAGSTGTGVVQLWDLRLMAHSLNVLGLDDRFLPQPTQPR
jgi:WD40 repeat protein